MVEETTNRKFMQISAAAVANLIQFSNGFSVSVSSYAIPQMSKGVYGIKYSEEETSWFASIFAIGCITGALLGSYTAEKFGRKKSIMLDCIVNIAAFVMTGYFTNFPLLLVARILAGHSGGSNLVATPIFVGETSHPSLRGFTGSLLIIEYCAGFTLSMLLGAIFQWRTVMYIATIFPVITFVCMCFLRESPTWLLRKGKEIEAVQALDFYRGNQTQVREEIERMKDNLRRIEKQKEAFGNTTVMEKLKANLRRLTDSTFLKPFMLLNLMLNIGLEWGGFPALAFYMHTILEEIRVPVDPYWVAILLAAWRSIICIGLSFILFKVPRRIMYLSSGSLVAIALFMQAAYAFLSPMFSEDIMVYARWIPLLAIIIQYLGFGLGWGAIMYMMQGEILPSDMRSFGSGLLGIIDNIFLFLSIKCVPILISSVGVGGMFGIYCGFVLLTITICFFTMPETKGMSLEDIEDYYTALRQNKQVKKIKLQACAENV